MASDPQVAPAPTNVDEVRDEKEKTDPTPPGISTTTVRKVNSNEKLSPPDTAGLPVEDVKADVYSTDEEEPTEEEKAVLRHIGEWLPWPVWLVAIVELCERFTYYGMQGLFQNYATYPQDGSTKGIVGLGFGHEGATGLGNFFTFFCYFTPILGAIIADEYLGRYKTILIFCFVYMAGLLLLTISSLPSVIPHAGKGGYIASLIIIGFGTGGIKSNVAPLIADQYRRKKMAITTTKTGERVIIDPAITIQRIYMIFYLCINLGSLSLMGTPYMERSFGFWSAYLLCLCMFVLGTSVLILGKKFYHVNPPQGGVIKNAFRVLFIWMKSWNIETAKPSYLAAQGSSRQVPWDDRFVDEVKRAMVAIQLFAVYPIYWVCYNQFSNNFVSQADQMNGHGIPNDFMQNFDSISIIVFIPVLDRLVYPALRKARINFPPINRIAFGFIIVCFAMEYAGILQHFIYKSGPCFENVPCKFPPGSDQTTPNDIHIAIQTPAYVLVGISEIFASVTGLEYAYTKAPVSMKSFVQSLFLLTSAFGSALSEAFVPLSVNPKIQWLFVGIGIAAFVSGILVWVFFHKYNDTEEEMNTM